MLQILTKLRYLCRETLSGLQRGGWMNWAAISTVTVSLFLFGLSLQTSWQLDALLAHFGSQLEISVYLQPDISGQDVIDQVQAFPTVQEVRVVSKEEAWQSLLYELRVADPDYATQQLEGNPLVDELKVTAYSPQSVPNLVERLTTLPQVDYCVYINEAREQFEQLQAGLSWVSLSLISILSITAIAVVTTTLHLIAVARRNELEIMQLVGATKVWIIIPFICQGILFGLAGGILSLILITTLRTLIAQFLFTEQEFLRFLTEQLTLTSLQMSLLPLILLSGGGGIGLISSYLALRRLALR
ncbi:ABC transporter permease [Spirulina subsalsa FACHB-351]|uniref:Cell division protein FtsX n=1 Tax=Spirulina subsalsa FACHB-351 TaxID=234711 RepID=A0ABT3L2Y4_9CYAN|nr:ABC transporter permease [Spirulina subsalsa]MCW6035864.1 ABC transporter permease [Spirulina subsalsa FACHB-351]